MGINFNNNKYTSSSSSSSFSYYKPLLLLIILILCAVYIGPSHTQNFVRQKCHNRCDRRKVMCLTSDTQLRIIFYPFVSRTYILGCCNNIACIVKLTK